jgi:hypothetical protein
MTWIECGRRAERDVHQPAARPLHVPGPRQQQRRRVERERDGTRHPASRRHGGGPLGVRALRCCSHGRDCCLRSAPLRDEPRAAPKHRLAREQVTAEQLRELERARSRFFANVSHEFRTPLTLTLGPLDDLRAGLHGPLAPADEGAGRAGATQRRTRTRPDRPAPRPRARGGGQHAAARAAVSTSAHSLMPGRPGLPPVRGAQSATTLDLSEFRMMPVTGLRGPGSSSRSVLANLLSNAVKFTPERGTVLVSVATDPRHGVHVAVRDSGPGIAGERAHNVFDRFHRVERSNRRVPSPGRASGWPWRGSSPSCTVARWTVNERNRILAARSR